VGGGLLSAFGRGEEGGTKSLPSSKSIRSREGALFPSSLEEKGKRQEKKLLPSSTGSTEGRSEKGGGVSEGENDLH